MSLRRPRLGPRTWAAVTLILSALAGTGLSIVHFGQASVLGQANLALDRFRDAKTELSRGFLFVNLAGLPGAPYEKAQGLALLDQADSSLDSFLTEWKKVVPADPTLEALVAEYCAKAPRLKTLLAVGDGTELRVAYFNLERVTDQIDDLTRDQMQGLISRLDGQFFLALGLTLALVFGLLAVLVSMGLARRRAEARLEAATLQLDQVTAGARVGLWHRDFRTGLTTVNPTWKELLGLDPGAPVPDLATWTQLIHPDDRTVVVEMSAAFHDLDQDSWQGGYRVVHPDGSVHWLMVRITADRGPDGVIAGIYGVNLDDTDRHLHEEEKARLEAQVAQAQRTEAVGRLAGGIAHDLNNLLVPLLAYSDLGLKNSGTKPPSHYFLKIQAVAERAAALTRQILAFSRQQVLEKRPLDLSALVGAFEPILRRTVPEDIRFDVRLGTGLPPVIADPGQVEQVVLNLVVNARDAMPQGGTLGIQTTFQTLDETFVATHFGAVTGPQVVLTISDTGVGIAPEVRDRIFEPFFTTKPRGEGTGLGLATVQGIVKQHGGHIGVYSEPGQGTVFQIFWPASPAASAPATDPARPEVRGGHETLLVVEDEETVREVVCESLEGQGYRVLSAPGPDQALEVTEAFSLLITDVVMPGLNGKELFEALAADRPGLRVLYMSGYTDRILSGADRDRPGRDFLQKPFAVDVLHRKVRDLLDTPTGS